VRTGQFSLRGNPVDDPPEDRVPIIDDPSREVPVVDPSRHDAPEPMREPPARGTDSEPV
jgi:hypothetical protein